jgi:hypothetical protein
MRITRMVGAVTLKVAVAALADTPRPEAEFYREWRATADKHEHNCFAVAL